MQEGFHRGCTVRILLLCARIQPTNGCGRDGVARHLLVPFGGTHLAQHLHAGEPHSNTHPLVVCRLPCHAPYSHRKHYQTAITQQASHPSPDSSACCARTSFAATNPHPMHCRPFTSKTRTRSQSPTNGQQQAVTRSQSHQHRARSKATAAWR